jgi:hypothetical protein
VPGDPGSHYTAGPIVAVVVVCLLGLVLRWIFGTGRRRSPGARPAPRPGQPNGGTGRPTDFGLLRQVAVLPARLEAEAARATLTAAGIRSTLTARPDGQVDVLVFAADVARARPLLPPAAGDPPDAGPPGAGPRATPS